MRNLFILAVCIFLSVSLAFAATDVQKYEVRLVKFELYESTNGWVTIFEGDANNLSSPLDIASAAASGQTVGTFMSGLTIPDGSYTKARATPYEIFTIRGIVNSGGTDYYTTSATTLTDGRWVSVATTTVGTPQDCTVTVKSSDMTPDSAGIDITGGPVVATNNIANKKVKVFFVMSSALTAVNTGPSSGIVYPGPPTVTITAE